LPGYDDFQRFLRDKEVNSEQFTRLTAEGEVPVPASEIRVGDWIVVQKDQRVPADMAFMKSSEAGGASFIRTGRASSDRRPAGR
jgi:phospholipid-translocating ATPase